MRATVLALALCGANALSTTGSEFLLRERFEAWKLEHSKVRPPPTLRPHATRRCQNFG